MQSSNIIKAVAAATVLGGVGVFAYVYSRRSRLSTASVSDEDAILSKEELIPVLKDLLRQFHGIFVEMANMVQRLKSLGALRGPSGPMAPEQIAEFLMHQGVQAKLDAAQAQVLSVHGVTEAQVSVSQELYTNDSEVQKFVNGFTEMFAEASLGVSPILPGLEIPASLTEDKVLEILAHIHQERVTGFKIALEKFWESPESKNITTPNQGPPPALAQALQAVHDQAEITVMQVHIDFVVDKVTFDSALSIYSRGADGAFMREKQRMERVHQVEIVNLMRNKDATTLKMEPVQGLSDKLICSNEGDMAHRILEAAENKTPVVSALVRRLDDPKAALTPLSEAIEEGKLEALVSRNTTFLYMPAHEDIPLANRPEYKNVDVCYIFFPRPDKQQRPIACFSLEELSEASTADATIYEGPGAQVFDTGLGNVV